MKVLVINAGSSSLKFTFFQTENEEMLAKGLIERLGTDSPKMIYKRSDGKVVEDSPKITSYTEAIAKVCEKLLDSEVGVIKDKNEVEAIGHRVVHGGERATKPVLVDAAVKDIIRECIPLAPLHNPPNLAGIEACEEFFTGVPNVAVFDTAFHQTMPPESYLYAVPYELYTKYGIRRYGFHGTSHNFVAKAVAKYLDKPYSSINLITCHLGNGCSMAAISKGEVIDTTMGMTPLEGLVMGTRCGDIDPAVVIRLAELGHSAKEIDELLNKKSGLLGVAGINSSDMRDIIQAAENGDNQAMRALKMFVRRIVKYVGAYYALLKGADAIVFTGGIGEYSVYIRGKILEKLSALDIFLDKKKNEECSGKPGIISLPESSWKAVVMPTNEELMIARQAVESLKSVN
ncbi:MAG: acetate kinase [Lentisphaerae bacterium GWF2_45_14]|nr:MAG: acetate kinase [Lentisphaerae bacterium GWF2_45_14]